MRASLILLAGLLAACKVDDSTSSNESDSTRVQLTNATNGTYQLRSLGQSIPAITPAGYGQTSGCAGFGPNPGLTVTFAGGTQPLFMGGSISERRSHVIVVGGNPGVEYAEIVLIPQANNDAQLLVFNARNGGAFDLYMNTPGAALGTPVSTNITNGQYTKPNVTVAPGTYQIRLTGTGTQTVVLDVSPVVLEPKQRMILVVAPPASGSVAVRSFSLNAC